LPGLATKGKIQAGGEGGLVNGASGGVGHFALQTPSPSAADVTGCAVRHVDMVRIIGSDRVLTTRRGIHQSAQRYETLIFGERQNHLLFFCSQNAEQSLNSNGIWSWRDGGAGSREGQWARLVVRSKALVGQLSQKFRHRLLQE